MKLKEKIKKIPGLLRGYMLFICSAGKLKIGKRCILCGNVSIEIGATASVKLGNNVFIRRFSSISASHGEIYIGNNVFLNRNVLIAAKEYIYIGNKTLLGPGVKIYDHDHMYDKNGVCNEYKTDQVIIGNNCWIGANAIILRGSRIGNNVVIGAGCIVKGEVPDNTVVIPEVRNKYMTIEN